LAAAFFAGIFLEIFFADFFAVFFTAVILTSFFEAVFLADGLTAALFVAILAIFRSAAPEILARWYWGV